MRRFVVVSVLFLSALLGHRILLSCLPDGEAHAEVLLQEQLETYKDPAARQDQRARLRQFNPEWDFMQRTFLLLSLADLALDQPDRQAELIGLMDEIIAETLADEARHGHRYFLLSYADREAFIDPQERSIFVDGEIALMLGARRLVEDDE